MATDFLHVNNPLSPLFKESLCIPLALLCCFCTYDLPTTAVLVHLGMKAWEVWELLASPPTDIDKHPVCACSGVADELAIELSPEESLLLFNIYILKHTVWRSLNCIGFWGSVLRSLSHCQLT